MKINTKNIFLVVISLTTMYSFSKGQTPVGGGIYSNTTWSLANSPYIVTDTVVVFPGVTLTIEPGVTVKFEDNMVLEVRQANIIAIGTVSDSITFTSNFATPNVNDWGRIYLNECKNTIFKFCSVRYADMGLYILDDYYATTDTLIISNSNFEYNNFGVQCFRLGRYHQYDNCNFSNNNEGYAIEFINTDTKTFFNNCNFSNNSVIGFQGRYYSSSPKKIHLNNCIVSFNNTFGVKEAFVDSCFLYNNGTAIEGSPRITNSIIKNNNHGINGSDTVSNCTINENSYGVTAVNISNCVIDSNLVYGVYGSGNVTNCQIKNNDVGIYLDDSTFLITQNFIEDNNIGIELDAYNHIYCNKICNNMQYNLKYTNPININLSNNYWCTPDSAATTMVIYDGYDDINYGLVTFMPIDTSQCYLDGCNLIVTATVTNATCDTCHNGSATGHVANGFAPYTWTWYTSPIQTTQTATGMSSGTYTLCVIDANGCTACNPNIFIDSTNCTGYSIVAHSTNATCSTCTDGEAWVDINGGSPPYSYTWYSIPMQNTPVADNL
ncbi:MAG: SprB repeat-containing protein [Bacteroidales bacterium]|nr:SprB repeat-containing protein [Bacteroidales bacterium]